MSFKFWALWTISVILLHEVGFRKVPFFLIKIVRGYNVYSIVKPNRLETNLQLEVLKQCKQDVFSKLSKL